MCKDNLRKNSHEKTRNCSEYSETHLRAKLRSRLRGFGERLKSVRIT